MYLAEELEGKLAVKGSTIYKCEPFVHVVEDVYMKSVCETCLSKGEKNKILRACAACHTAMFCCKTCQKKAWPVHKMECKGINATQTRGMPSIIRLLAKLIFKLKITNHYEEKLSSTTTRGISDLMSRRAHTSAILDKYFMIPGYKSAFETYVGKDNMPNTNTLYDLFGKIIINSSPINDAQGVIIGQGLYISFSSLNHSCAPNACVSYIGTTCVVQLVTDVPDFKVEKVYISYLPPNRQSRQTRREYLKGVCHFDCNCTRCADVEIIAQERSAKCRTSGCDHPVKVSKKKIGPCRKCDYDGFTQEDFKEFLRLEQTKRELLENPDVSQYPRRYRTLVYAMERVFHPLNTSYIELLLELSDLGAYFGDTLNSMTYARAALPGFRNEPFGMATLLLRIAGQEKSCGLSVQSNATYKEARETVMVILGADHPYLKKGGIFYSMAEPNLLRRQGTLFQENLRAAFEQALFSSFTRNMFI